MNDTTTKTTLKELRTLRKAAIDRTRRQIKTWNKRFSAVREQIATEAKTVPEIAAATGMDTAQTLIVVSAMKKFGEAVEGAKDGDYFRYQAAGK